MNELPITIGLTVLNGEKFIKKRLENILSQTFSNFRLVISNNASKDATLLICEEFAKKDSRIEIFSQDKTIVWEKNFAFVLQQTTSKYFVWASVDDLWEKKFLEKNFDFLEKNKKYVNCSGKVKRFGAEEIDTIIGPNDTFMIKVYKKIRSEFRPFYNLSFEGSHEEKISKCFRHNNMLFLFGLFRTDVLKKCVIDYSRHSSDLIMCLKVLEFGDVKILNDVTWHYYVKGLSTIGIIEKFKIKENSFLEIFFPFLPITMWCKNEFGIKFIIKNFRHVIWVNTIFGLTPLFLEIFKIKNKI